ncbi:unannotated protein [freshwater metagenome]|uniref:Unannotated protein n=1 Tax=freshwater metagenome TaxID=449393 RepID=A0A6J7ELZ2_9ZZZZ
MAGASLRGMSESSSETTDPAPADIDLDAIEIDLADVETALARLESGTYWTDEITGQPLSDELLAQHPTARRTPEQ